MEKHLLETNEFFTFLRTDKCKNQRFEVYMDDYGQSFVLAWVEDGEVREWCCGAYNDYYYDMHDIADYLNEKQKKMSEKSNEKTLDEN